MLAHGYFKCGSFAILVPLVASAPCASLMIAASYTILTVHELPDYSMHNLLLSVHSVSSATCPGAAIANHILDTVGHASASLHALSVALKVAHSSA